MVERERYDRVPELDAFGALVLAIAARAAGYQQASVLLHQLVDSTHLPVVRESFYSVLHRSEALGLLESKKSGGQIYFRITRKGRKRLQKFAVFWESFLPKLARATQGNL